MSRLAGEPATAGGALRSAVTGLRARGPGARYDATLLLAHVLGRDAAWLLAHDDVVLSADEADRYRAAVARRAAGEPVPYIIGTAGFYGRLFHVDPDVLVPRPETEAIVDEVLDHLRARNASEPLLCDVGTGSGALAVTLACERAGARLVAVDLSPAALAVARRNARVHGVAERIAFVLGDGLAAAVAAPAGAGARARGPFAGIVANLPYVKTADLPLAPDPASFEPRLALHGGRDGLDLYRALLAEAPSLLEAGGVLVMEAGPDTVPELADLARAAFPPTARLRTVRDRAGLDRLVVVRVAG